MRSIFPHPWWNCYTNIGDPMKTLEEVTIINICNSIREKPEWKAKYKNTEIANKWTNEIRDGFKDKTENLEEVIAYVFKELEWTEYLEHTFPGVEETGFHIGVEDRIVYSDKVIDAETKSSLIEAVERFTKEEFKDGYDYHPGSNNQVIDLVHPSLYPLQYGKTPIFSNPPEDLKFWEASKIKPEDKYNNRTFGTASYDETIAKVKSLVDDFGISKKFQWLPAKLKLDFSANYSFLSYINNLHPIKYEDLYKVIAKIFTLLAPGINFCLSRYSSGAFTRIKLPQYESWATDEWQKKLELMEDPPANPETGEEVEPDYDAIEEYIETKKDHLRKFPPVWNKDPPVNYSFDIKKFGDLKVIVKLANIELTPENPSYNGGSWHVEGTINEDIVATLIYYYDCDNISDLTLSFKGAFEDPQYEQGDVEGVQKFYGLLDEDKMSKVIGSMETKEDRVLIFPNWFQHHVDPFELTDKTKPGHRKILCLFIVDPFNDKVLATDMVPPQQKSWWEDGTDLTSYGLNEFSKLEILKLKENNWPVSLDEIKPVREELMSERTIPEVDEDDYSEFSFQRKFSLCEH